MLIDIKRRNPKMNNVYLETGSFFSVLAIIDPTVTTPPAKARRQRLGTLALSGPRSS